MPQTEVRVVGSGFTTLHFNAQPIAFLDSFDDSGQTAFGGPQGNGWEAIHPLGHRTPVEIATSRVMGAGRITASVRELWGQPVWANLAKGLPGLAGKRNILQVWDLLSEQRSALTCQMLIKVPGADRKNDRRKVYHNCVITAIDTGETVQIGTLSVAKNIEIVYTRATWGFGNGGGKGD